MRFFKSLKKQNHFNREKVLSDFEYQTIKEGLNYSMASWERLYGNINSINYLIESRVEGAIVECGVWRGGSMLAMIQTLIQSSCTDRTIFLYDTFSGMSMPSDQDGSFAFKKFKELQTGADKSDWCCADLDDVKQTLSLSNYPQEKIRFIEGKIEDTIPGQLVPDKIALLRLDMDWYEPTHHALKHLFPKLVTGGVLIIDDYGHWDGCKQAVDEYLEVNKIHLLLNRIDYTGRIAVKI